jgi:hypothetical protein
MQIAKIVNKVFAPVMKEVGFLKLPTKQSGMGRFAWTFGKEIREKLYHIIQVQVNSLPYHSGIDYKVNICLMTTFPHGARVGLPGLIEDLPAEIRDWRKAYSTEQEIEEYLTIAARVVVESALPMFEYFDRSLIIAPTELDRELSQDTNKRADCFKTKHDLRFCDDIAGVKTMILRTEDIIKTVQFYSLPAASGLLVDATAYYGELIRRVHGGEWAWTPDGEVFYLQNVGGNALCESGALGVTFNYWIWPEIYGESLRAHYKTLLYRLGIEDYV